MTSSSSAQLQLDWLKAFTRFRSEIVPCSCGKNEVFIQNAASTLCEACKRMVKIEHRIHFNDYTMAASKGARVYRCQLGICNPDDALMPVAVIVAKDSNPTVLGVRNMTQKIWEAQTPSGKINRVDPGQVIPFLPGIKIKVFDHSFELE